MTAKNLYEQLVDGENDTMVGVVAALCGIDTVGSSFRNYLRDTPAIAEPFKMGDAAIAYLENRLAAVKYHRSQREAKPDEQIVRAVSGNGNTVYWTGFDLSAHALDAATYSSPRTANEAAVRAGKHYPLLKFEVRPK